jgi:carbamoyltransferase
MHCGHNGSVTISKNNKLIVHTELERFSKIKYSGHVSNILIKKINELNIFFDLIVISHWQLNKNIFYMENKIFFLKLNRNKNCCIILEDLKFPHHFYHALSAIYNTNINFDQVIVLDEMGKIKGNYNEIESVYDNNLKEIKKKYYDKHVSLGIAYKIISLALGFNYLEGGKTMAFSTFGKIKKNIYKKLFINNVFNEKYFPFYSPHLIFNKDVAINLHKNLTTDKHNNFSKDYIKTFQKICEDYSLNFLKNIKNKKIILTGGVFQNVLINTILSKKTSNKIYVDPMCNDQGISLGMNFFYTHRKLKKENSIYLGFEPQYNDLKSLFKNFKIVSSNEEEVSNILINEPVALFQGRSEQGQRGLGNRSLLIDATNLKAIEKINSIKKREWYRPFACSILEKNMKDWFIVDNDRCPYYMMFVFKAKKNKIKKISSVISKDGTCRLQAVTPDHNLNYYNLIKSFYKKTKIPLLLNTSLNLPGETIVEDLIDLKNMFVNSSLNYAWLPDINKLIIKYDRS